MLAPSGRDGEIEHVTARGLVANPEWSLVFEDGVLLVSGGADAVYAFPDLDHHDALALAEAWRSGSLDPSGFSTDVREAIFRLRDLGAVRGKAREVTSVGVELRFVGDPLRELSGELEQHGLHAVAEHADLVVFVRTNAGLGETCAAGYEALRAPHLLLDLGFHHTLSLGPLVFPGETACLACLVGRIARSWGDARPPERPAVTKHASLAAALLALEVESFAAGDHRLVNETVSISLDRLETRRGSVHRLPWCPVCREEATPLGSIPLPWATER